MQRNPVDRELRRHLPVDLAALCLDMYTSVPFIEEVDAATTRKHILKCAEEGLLPYVECLPLSALQETWVFVAQCYVLVVPESYNHKVLPLVQKRPNTELIKDMLACAAFGFLRQIQTMHEIGVLCTPRALYLAFMHRQLETAAYLYEHGARLERQFHLPFDMAHYHAELVIRRRGPVSECPICRSPKKDSCLLC